ncbi:hypothetical protein H8E88_05885 [candidate division KSB1 bacterium]|nr:hypothetical protein [candidate division KSB1 bacterium]MBL7093535.1 hypothetical protein [candidate division KSB1 bacterium]
MIKSKVLYQVILICSMLISCEKYSINHQESFTVSGYVYYLNEPVENVTISIDEQFNWNANTNSEGFFKITGVSSGDHKLNMRKSINNILNSSGDTSGFTEKTLDISVYEDVNLSYLKLPKAVYLYEAMDISELSAKIFWSPTDDEGFREYKLFRHSTSGLDETTGTLMHVSTSLTDTSFVDNQLNPFQNYHYRVYVMNEYGRIGGSNIIQIQTKNVQLIRNSGFEEISEEEPIYWTLVRNPGNPDNSIIIDSTDAIEGNNSLKFHHAEESGCWEMWITQDLNKSFLIGGATYKLSLGFKADFVGQTGFNLILRNSTIDLWLNVPIKIDEEGEWSMIFYEFGLPDTIGNNDVKMTIHFCNQGVKSWWLDNIKLEKSE